MKQRMRDVWHSFRALPAWVQWWLAAVLVPVNAAPFFFLDTMTGQAGALASVIVIAGNVPLMLAQRGMSRLLSIPHLLAWIPLTALLAARLLVVDDIGTAETALAATLLTVNAISLAFDTLDAWRWLCGQRDVAGPSDAMQSPETCA
jgi:hypothetical protein